jgi:hypothetical protein
MAHQARFRRVGAGLLFLLWGLMLAGCGGRSQGTVSGKVSYKTIQEDGSYTVPKVPTSPATITVETKSIRPIPKSALPGPYAKMPKDLAPEGYNPPGSAGDAKRYVPIPDQYADHERSGLSLDVTSDPQTHNIDLK